MALLGQLDDNERMTYTHIKAADNRGIWLADIMRNANLHRSVVTKAIKSLESKMIIKSVRSVKNPSKKMYMLYELEPSVDITGGAWFTDNELDVAFVSTLSRACVKFIIDKCTPKVKGAIFPVNYKYPSAKDVASFINSKGITATELTPEDLEELLEMLVDDRQLERIAGVETGYRPDPRSTFLRDFSSESVQVEDKLRAWTEVPCGKCPVADLCSDVGPITPSSCIYFKTWLDM